MQPVPREAAAPVEPVDGVARGARVLLLGGGGREHAIAAALLGVHPTRDGAKQSVSHLFVCPGNAGMLALPRTHAVTSIDSPTQVEAVVRFASEHHIDLVVVGPEAPLELGIADKLAAAGVPCFGPTQAAARLETSKRWCKDFLVRHGIPTARHKAFGRQDLEAAVAYIQTLPCPPVIKASGLAAGKGVIVAATADEAVAAARSMLESRIHGEAGDEIVVEERLEGPEVSVLAFSDGNAVALLPPAQDHKRAFEFDRGPNTGGMGAFAPSTLLSSAQLERVKSDVMQRTIDAMRAEGTPFVGVLYAGLMLTRDGPRVLEFNARFGDPETQAILPLLDSDLFDILHACATRALRQDLVRFQRGKFSATVVAAMEGYPGRYANGAEVHFDAAALPPNAAVYHAGTSLSADGRVITTGGRVVCVSATAPSLQGAVQSAYAGMSTIQFDGMFYRRDIGGRYLRPGAGLTPLRVGVLGSTRGTDLSPILHAIEADDLPGVKVAVVISNKTDAGILEKAAAAGIPTAVVSGAGKSREEFDADVVRILSTHDIDLVLLIGFMRIVSRVITDRYAWRLLNVHPSLLPEFAGGMDVAVHEAVLRAGKRETGCTIHFVDETVDGGALLVQRSCPVLASDTPQTLKERVQSLEGSAFIDALRMFTDDASVDILDLLRRRGEQWTEVAGLLPSSRIPARSTVGGDAPLTYAAAGVDIDAGDALVERIKPLAKSTARTGADAELGGFGALFDLKAAGYVDPLLVSSTDGVGTKLRIAQVAGNHTTVGIDLVAMSVNDLVVQGAEPLLFLDYYATGHLDVGEAGDVIAGIAEGCRQAGCALAGGETAEMPSMYAHGDYDLAGFAVGAVERNCVLPLLDAEAPGDVVLGIASSGVHSNGFSLVRRVVEKYGIDWHAPPPFTSSRSRLCDELLTPTKIYIKCLLPSIRADGGSKIKAMAHITGGGLPDNIPRVIRSDLQVHIDANTWEIPPVFRWMQRLGSGISVEEMARTFNIGIGMIVVVASDRASDVMASIEKNGERVYRIGTLQSREVADEPCVVLGNLESAFAR